MQMSPQAPPYTDTPPAYSEVGDHMSILFNRKHFDTCLNLFYLCAADIPAQIRASTSGAWSDASDVLSLPWCSGVHAHAATHVSWAGGSECPHGLLSHGTYVPPWFNSDGGQRL